MLCCVSRKTSSSTRSNNEDSNDENYRKPIDFISLNYKSSSSSGSNGDFGNSATSGGLSSSSSTSSSTSGFSSGSPSLCVFSNSSSDTSSSNSEFTDTFFDGSGMFDENLSKHRSSGYPPVPPKRMQTFSTPASKEKCLVISGNGDSVGSKKNSAEDEPPVLLPCAICARTFKPESLEKHTIICERAAIKKRKPFDSAKQRIQGTELAEFLPKETVKKKVYIQEDKQVAVSKGSWKQTHAEFLRAIRAARGETIDVPPHRAVVASQNVTVGVPTRPNEKGMCPTCNRQFSIKSYERHVAWCKERAIRVPMTAATNIAKERLEARMKYRAPQLKNRRITNREKYSPGSAMNLPSLASKNSPPNQRAKESVSTPNCNKSGNEAAPGNSQNQKPTTTGKRSGQGREGTSSGPMKSRLSDRSNRPSTEIEFGPTTSPSPRPFSPRRNSHHRHSRHSLTRAVLPRSSTSPISSLSFSRQSRIVDSTDIESSRRTGEKRGNGENCSNLSKRHQKRNIVYARSHGNPKVNNIAVNNEVIGMTVQACGVLNHENHHKELTTWKQISREKNSKNIDFLKLDDIIDERDPEELINGAGEFGVSESIVQKGTNSSLRNSTDLEDISWARGIKRLDRTYLIKESLDRTVWPSIVSSPKADYLFLEQTPRIEDFCKNPMSPNRFNTDAKVTSSPLQRKEDKTTTIDESTEAFGIVTSPLSSGRVKLAPLNLKIIENSNDFDDGQSTLKSGTSSTSLSKSYREALKKKLPKLMPIIGKDLANEKPLNFRSHDDKDDESLNDSRQSLEDIQSKMRKEENQELLHFSSSVERSALSKRRSVRKINKKCAKIESIESGKPQLERYDNHRETLTKSEEFEKMVPKVEGNYTFESPETTKSFDNAKFLRTNCDVPITQKSPKVRSIIREKFEFSEKSSEIVTKNKSSEKVNCKSGNYETSELLNTPNRTVGCTVPLRASCELSRVQKLPGIKSLDNDELPFSAKNSGTLAKNKFSEKSNLQASNSETPGPLDKSESDEDAVSRNLDSSSLTTIASQPKIESGLVSNGSSSLHISKNKVDEKPATTRSSPDAIENPLKVPAPGNEDKVAGSSFEIGEEESVESFDESIEPQLNSSQLVEVEKTSASLQTPLQRCGTYVINEATIFNLRAKHPASDESLEDKPAPKKRRTEDEMIEKQAEGIGSLDDTPDKITNLLEILSITPKHCNISKKLGEVAATNDNKTKYENGSEVYQKYVNQDFDYDTDNNLADDNFVDNSNDPDDQTTFEGKLSSENNLSVIELPAKAFSDSIVTGEKILLDSPPRSPRDSVMQCPKKIRKKLEKKLRLLRGSTDTLISSLESSVAIDDEKSLPMIVSLETEPELRDSEETICKLETDKLSETVETTKTSRCSFLPEIPVERIAAKSEKKKIDGTYVPLDSIPFWERSKNNPSARLINLDLPKCRDNNNIPARSSKFASLPPVVPATFRKVKRSGKDYDPFLMAERQMNELMSDTCSDQSFTDSPSNRRRSSSPIAPNYPLAHSSAFVKYPDPVTRSLSSSEKRASLIAPPSAFDDLVTDFSSDSTETNSISRDILADLEDSSRARENCFELDGKVKNNRELGRRVIIDKSKALGTSEMIHDSTAIRPNRGTSQTNEKARKLLENVTPKVVRPHVNRSSSVRSTSAPKNVERKNNNSSVNKINPRSNQQLGMNNRNNNYASLSGSNVSLSSIVSSEIEVKRANSISDELASSFEDDASGTYPSLRSLLKNDSLSVSSPVQTNRPRNGQISDEELSSPDSYKRHDQSKLSADSAYSSLNRKYSNHGRSTTDMAMRNDGDSPLRRRESEIGTCSATSKMSNFCHDCGYKFVLETAKFCCECGMKRLAI